MEAILGCKTHVCFHVVPAEAGVNKNLSIPRPNDFGVCGRQWVKWNLLLSNPYTF